MGPGLEILYAVGQRVIVGAITPCGQCFYCLNGSHSQCGGPLGGWRFGNTINGAWAEYLLVPDAKRQPRAHSRGLADEDVMLCPDIFSTGLSGAESGSIESATRSRSSPRGRSVCARPLAPGCKGASLIIGVDRDAASDSRWPAASAPTSRSTSTRAIPLPRSSGSPTAAAWTWRSRRSGARRRSRTRCGRRGLAGCCRAWASIPGKLVAPYEAFYAGLGDQTIVTTLCPGGKERMRRLMAMIEHERVDLSSLVTHRFSLDDIEEAFDLFSSGATVF